MSAKELTFFQPKGFNKEEVIPYLVDDLALGVIDIPGNLRLGYQLLARRGEGRSILKIEYMEDARAIIQELSQWKGPSERYKNLLSGHSCINLFYRDFENARIFIQSIVSAPDQIIDNCVVENEEGCLLLLSDMSGCLSKDKTWSWEKEEFPELPDVAISEWREIE